MGKLIGTTELTLSAYHFGSILAGHAQKMQPFCALFMLVALALHVVIGDIEGCPLIVGLAMAHICLGLFWKRKDEGKTQYWPRMGDFDSSAEFYALMRMRQALLGFFCDQMTI